MYPLIRITMFAILFASSTQLVADDQPELPKPIHEFDDHSHAVSCLKFSSDGRFLFSTSFDNTVRVWDVESGKLVATLDGGPLQQLWDLSIDPKGRYLAAAGNRGIRVWKLDKKFTHLRDIKAQGKGPMMGMTVEVAFMSVEFSPDGRYLIGGGDNPVVYMWQVAKWKRLDSLTGHEKMKNSGDQEQGVLEVAFVEFLDYSPDGKRILSGGKTQAYRLWGFDRRKKAWTTLRAFPEPEKPDWPAHRLEGVFSPDGKTAAVSGTDGVLQLVDVKKGKVRHRIEIASGSFLNDVAFSSDSKRVFSVAKKLHIHAVKSGKLERALPLPEEGVALATAESGKVAVATKDHVVRLYTFND